MSSVPWVYRALVRAAHATSPLWARGSAKLARGVAGRRTSGEALGGWGRRGRDAARSTVWLHAPSVGEGLQGAEVVRALRALRPGLQVAFTHFSPSAEALGAEVGADVSAYLPWDLRPAVAAALDAVEPDLLVFTKTEVWPVLVAEATRRGVPSVLVAGSVPARSGRLRTPARELLRSTWARLRLACACSAADADALRRLGVPAEALRTTGDPAVDSARRRAGQPDRGDLPLSALDDTRPTLVAGSTWGPDEDALFAALRLIEGPVGDLRVVVAPHEPSPRRVRSVLERARGLGWDAAAFPGGGAGIGPARVWVVDRVGFLAGLYGVADVAFVGGGFGRDGLHSVLEPAAAGAPVIFGPHHEGSRAAGDLLARAAARRASGPDELADALTDWLGDAAKRNGASGRAVAYIDENTGAAERTAALLDPLVDHRNRS